MPNPSSASDSSFERKTVAEALYLERGAADASIRCDLNATLGALDLGTEILARLQLQPGETVFDVACGAGQHLARYSAAVGPMGRAFGTDFSPDAIAKVRGRELEAAVAPAWELPAPDACADALTCNYAIYYFDDLARTLAEWRRVLKPGGRLLITGPAADNNADFYAFHKAATGSDPSDADRMALGFITRVVSPALVAAGFVEKREAELVNPVRFPDVETYLNYWVATSLFARTANANREQGTALLTHERRDLVVTKRVTVVQARRE